MLENIMLGLEYGVTGATIVGTFVVGMLLLIPVIVVAANVIAFILNVGGGKRE